ncbi:MAG: hypothetical protein DRG50_01475 [Deltaproteobacteria bacterium]|nr:MAG: hypothetical protein DRG50_01475 [Deltaproteobacteria bacterium]
MAITWISSSSLLFVYSTPFLYYLGTLYLSKLHAIFKAPASALKPSPSTSSLYKWRPAGDNLGHLSRQKIVTQFFPIFIYGNNPMAAIP